MNLTQLFSAGLAFVLAGCTGYGIILAPKNPLTNRGRNTSLRKDLYGANDLSGYMTSYWKATTEEQRQRLRNEIVHRLMAETDDNFLQWSQRVFGARVTGNALADAGTGILSTIAAGSGAAAGRGISVAIASITGVRVAADKNFFLEQNASALYSKMKEQRTIVAIQMEQYLAQNTTKYPLNKALQDIERYYEAGTLGAASSHLAADAHEASLVAEAVQEKGKGDRIASNFSGSGFSRFTLPPVREYVSTPSNVVKDNLAAAAALETRITRQQGLLDAVEKARTSLAAENKKLDYGEIVKAADLGNQYPLTYGGYVLLLERGNLTDAQLTNMTHAAEKAPSK